MKMIKYYLGKHNFVINLDSVSERCMVCIGNWFKMGCAGDLEIYLQWVLILFFLDCNVMGKLGDKKTKTYNQRAREEKYMCVSYWSFELLVNELNQ